MKLSSFFSKIRAFFLKDKAEEGAVVVGREEFAREMKEKFKGNIRLLKAIEEGMNRDVKPHERVSLTG